MTIAPLGIGRTGRTGGLDGGGAIFGDSERLLFRNVGGDELRGLRPRVTFTDFLFSAAESEAGRVGFLSFFDFFGTAASSCDADESGSLKLRLTDLTDREGWWRILAGRFDRTVSSWLEPHGI